MPPGPADRGDDVAAVAEREDRELETQLRASCVRMTGSYGRHPQTCNTF